MGILSILISLRAKPIGNLPYRWGVYNGLGAALAAVRLLGAFFTVPAARADALTTALLSLIVVLMVAASVGTLLRRKLGIVALALAYTVLLAAVRFLDSAGVFASQPGEMPASAISYTILLVCYVLYAIPNVIYFRARWNLLA